MKIPHELDYKGNARQILKLIFRHRKITRKRLSELTGLSSLTIAKVAKTMIADRIVIETDAEDSDKGRKPLLLAVNSDYGYVIGIDIGAYSTKIGVVDFSCELVEKHTFISADPTGAPSIVISVTDLMHRITGIVEKFGRDRILGIGIGVSGLVDYDAQTIVFCPNIAGYNNLSISQLLRERLNVPVVVDSSARCMALGEKYFGQLGYRSELAFVSVGHSVAVGTIIQDRAFRGCGGFAGELGHIKVKPEDDFVCTCGSSGCSEGYTTLPMVRLALQKKLSDYRGYSLLNERCGDIQNITYDDIADAGMKGDKLTIDVLESAVAQLTTALANYINLFNPRLLVLGGGFFDLFPYMQAQVDYNLQKKCLTPSFQRLQIHFSNLSDNGAIQGCAMQLIQDYFE